MRTDTLLAIMTLCSGAAAADFTAHEWTAPNDFTVRYRLSSPEKIEEGKAYPVILFLHGLGERGTDNEAQLKHGARAIVETTTRLGQPVFVIAPQCPPDRWWSPVDGPPYVRLTAADQPNPATEGVLALIEDFSQKNPADPKRLYVTGLSMGGFATWDILGRSPEKIAAAMPVCGGGNTELVSRFKDIPIRTYHGDKDTVVPLEASRRMITALENAGGKPELIIYPGVQHDSWTRTYASPDALKWLLSHTKP